MKLAAETKQNDKCNLDCHLDNVFMFGDFYYGHTREVSFHAMKINQMV